MSAAPFPPLCLLHNRDGPSRRSDADGKDRARSAGLTQRRVLFYPTAAYAWYVARLEQRAEQVLDEGERAPLLSRDEGV